MKVNGYGIAGIALLAALLLSLTATAAAPANNNYDFGYFAAPYGQDVIDRLIKLFNAMQGKGLTPLQQQLMLSQALVETGLFTDNPNFNNMDNLNNYAGITGNSRYGAGPGSMYAKYPSLDAFVDDWMFLLGTKNDPLDATGVQDFNAKLKANGYYTDSATTYGNNLAYYYNLLSDHLNS